jgi:PAS domain S-box-containing protein
MRHDAQTRPSESGTPHRTERATKGPPKIAVNSESSSTDIRLEISDILDAFPVYVMLVDEHHHILLANSAVRTQLGVDPKDIVGKYCPTVIHGLDKPIDACPLEEAAERNQAVEREILDPGSKRWVRSAIYPTRGSTADGRRIFFHMIADITDRKQAEEQLRAANEQLRDLSRHLESVREEERTKLAGEIHDELGQLLTALKIDVSWMAKRLPKAEGLLVEKAKTVNKLIDEAVQTVKRVSSELRPGVLDHLGLTAAIEWQAQQLEKRTEIRFEFKSSAKEIVLDRDRSTTIFRICQEALTNVVRHANASKVKITLKEEPGRIVLRISDNGKGIEEEQLSDPKAFGLISMRERARSWGGDVKINGSPGKGTVVMVSIPLVSRGDLDAEDTDCR